ncbi:PH domain-containing protein [candidate division WWE3 bacterium]|nr:PH domain-containing protein [candidate division WWE3 bacterium]
MTALQPFATFLYDEDQIRSIQFATQQNDEVIKLFVRRDGITNVPWIALTVLLLLLPQILTSISGANDFVGLQGLIDSLSPAEILFSCFLYYLVVMYYAFLRFLEWYFTVLIATNKRILDFDYNPPFFRETTQAQLRDIQDVSHTQSGIFAIIFNYGTVHLQTAGTRQNISLSQVPNPHQVHNILINLLKK